uniref:Uncharacterized protein n=1 Tax=Parascaris univalens TaxID=6257 RepID=A0A915AVS5_PARUN
LRSLIAHVQLLLLSAFHLRADMTDLNQTDTTLNNPKPMEEEEEEDEDYAPPVRPQRYIYKYHRVGTGSLEKIAGPATTPPTKNVEEAAMESTSLSTESNPLITRMAENLAEETPNIEQKPPTTLTDGEIHLGNSLGFSNAESAEPTAISSLPTTLTEGQALSEAAPSEEAPTIAPPGNDADAGSEYVSRDETLAVQLTQTDSTSDLPLEGISSEPVEQSPIVNKSSAETAASELACTEPTGPLSETNNPPSIESTSQEGVNEVITGLTQDGVAVVSGIISSETSQEGVNEVITGLTQDGVAVVSGIISNESDALQRSYEGTQKVISGVTLDRMEVLGGLSVVLSEQQQSPEKASDISTKVAEEHVEEKFNADATSVDLGASAQPSTFPQHEQFLQQELLPHYTTEGDLLPQELRPKRDTCGAVEVICGVTNDNVTIVSGLSSIYTLPESKHEKQYELSSMKGIVSGITAAGVEIISGLAFEHTVMTASSNAQTHAEDLSAPSITPLEVVSGLTSDNQEVIAGVAMNISRVHDINENHADIPVVAVQKAPDVTTDIVQSESSQVPLQLSNLPPVDVPMRSDSF